MRQGKQVVWDGEIGDENEDRKCRQRHEESLTMGTCDGRRCNDEGRISSSYLQKKKKR